MLFKTHHTHFRAQAFSGPEEGPHLLVIAGIHGDEYEPMLAASRLAAGCSKLLQKGRLTIVPVVNHAALERTSRCGADGLDLARTMPGKAAGSPTEQLADELTALIRTADYLIDMHTGGALFDILPLSGYLLHADENVLAAQHRMAQAFGLPIVWGTDASVEGRTLSVARDHGIPAIYAESGGGLRINTATINSYEQGCIEVMHALQMTGKTHKLKTPSIWLEDYRMGQGHLQVKLPSPQSGLFLPAVGLGTRVRKGSLLGHVIDPIQNKLAGIKANEAGTVFMLRISAYVHKGEALGGILPISKPGKKIIHAE